MPTGHKFYTDQYLLTNHNLKINISQVFGKSSDFHDVIVSVQPNIRSSQMSICYIPVEQTFYGDESLLRNHSLKINIFGDI